MKIMKKKFNNNDIVDEPYGYSYTTGEVMFSTQFLLHPSEKHHFASFSVHPQSPPFNRQFPTLLKMLLSFKNIFSTEPAVKVISP